jgi:hypothetical protein
MEIRIEHEPGIDGVTLLRDRVHLAGPKPV